MTNNSASLAQLEQTIAQAIEDDEHAICTMESSLRRDSDTLPFPRSIREIVSGEAEDASAHDGYHSDRLRVAPLRQARHDSGKRRNTSISSESIVSGSEGSFYGGTAPTSPISFNTTRSPSQSMMGRISLSPNRSEQPSDGTIDDRTHEKVHWEEYSEYQDKMSLMERSSDGSQENTHHRVLAAVSNAMYQLRQVRLKEQLARPIRYDPQNSVHKPMPKVVYLFEASVNEELQVRRLITRDWLRVSTWWLLKARVTLANSSRNNYVSARGSLSPSSDSASSSHQAYINLLKASYILYEIVLKDESSPALLTDENRKSIAELSEVHRFYFLSLCGIYL